MLNKNLQNARGINLFGSLRAENGLGAAARGFLLALKSQRIPVTGISCYDGSFENKETTVTELSDEPLYSHNLFVTPPLHSGVQGPRMYPKHYNIGHWVWETLSIPDLFLHELDSINELWVPSHFVRQIFEPVYHKQLVRIPYPVHVSPSKGATRKTFNLPEDPVIFLFRFDLLSHVERKNPDAVILAFLEAFANNTNALLVLHVLHASSFPSEWDRLLSLCRNARNIRLIDQIFSKSDVDALTSVCDVFVSLHRSEGFGLNLAEAMALGKPVIATGYSGNMDFMNENNSIPIPFKLVSLNRQIGPYPSSALWAEPDIDSAIKQMKHLYEDASLRKLLGSRAALDIAKNYHSSKIGELMNACLQKGQEKSFSQSKQFSVRSQIKNHIGVNLFGSLRSETGLGTASRGFLRALKSQNIPVTGISCYDESLENQDTTITELSDNPIYSHNLFVRPPPYGDTKNAKMYPKHYNIGHWVWETLSVPDFFSYELDYLDELWLPSHFAKQIFEPIYHKPITRIPYPIQVSPTKGATRKTFNLPEDPVIFLFRFDLLSYVERKNPDAVILAFLEAFSSNTNALLVLHVLHASSFPSEWDRLLSLCRNARNIRLIDQIFSKSDVDALTSVCDVFVSLHRTEGFGLNLAEAMALGKPVIATGYSGNMDFMNENNSIPVPFKLVPINKRVGFYKPNALWAEPDIDYAVKQMKRLYENASLRKLLGSKAALDIAKNYNSWTIGEMMNTRLQKDQERSLSRNTQSVSRPHLKISCIIPFYNGKRFLKKAVDSVIKQTTSPYELIIVNNNSQEEIPEEITSLKPRFPIRIVEHKQPGQSSARNYGVEISQGDYIAFLDQDDIWDDRHLEKLVWPFIDPKNADAYKIGWSYSNIDLINENGFLLAKNVLSSTEQLYNHPKTSLFQMLSNGNFIYPSACMVRKTAFIEAGGFDPFLCGYEDDDLFTRLFVRGWGNYFIGEALTQWRFHFSNASITSKIDNSRMIYFKKLLQEWPDRPLTQEYWVRKAIVPRFIRETLYRYVYLCIALKEFSKVHYLYEHLREYIRVLPFYLRVKYKLATFFLYSPRLAYLLCQLLYIFIPQSTRNKLFKNVLHF